VVVLGGALFLTKRGADRAADASIATALDATQSAIRDALESRSRTLAQTAAALARVPSYAARIGEVSTGARANLLDQADEFRSQTHAAWTLLTDNTGALRAWTLHRDQSGEDFSNGSLVGLALEGTPTEGLWIEPGETGDELYQAVGVPIKNPAGTTTYGVLVAALPIDSAFAAELKRHTNSDIVFFTRDTMGAPHVALSTLPKGTLDTAITALSIDSSFAEEGNGVPIHVRSGGESWLGLAGPLLAADGFALGGYAGLRARSVELAAYASLRHTMMVAFGVGLVLALIISLLVARQVTQPVHRLVALTRLVSEGRFTGTFTARSKDEIGELASAFDRMVHDLKEKQELVEYLSGTGGQTLTLRTVTESATQITPAPGSSQVLMPGRVLAGRYEIKEILGAGGMGVVYRAFDRELQETIAIKTLRPELVRAGGTTLERFKQEIRLARKISHRNVLRTHDLGEADGAYYITMEYAEGTSLAELIRKRGRLPVSVALTIGKQLCRALEAAHEEGVVHRDIKPQNLMIDPSGFLKVMDFGIARLAEDARQQDKGLTVAGMMIGTPDYMSPEQLMGQPLDGRADLYAVGAVLFECLTGRTVFAEPTVTAVIAAQLQDPPVDPRTLNTEIPEPLALMILKALAKQRNDRFAGAAEMYEALEAVG
jgi:HAMP domain-containing protein